MKNLIQRTLTGILFVVTIIGSILFDPIVFFGVCLLVAILGMMGLKKMLERKYDKVNLLASLLLGLSFQILVFLNTQGIISEKWYVVLMPLVWLPFIHELFKGGDHPFQRIALTLLVPVYVSLPLTFLYLFGSANGGFNSSLLLGFFAMVWCNDTGAYVVGVSIGKHKLYERISPKKTWEGFIGGIVFTLVAAWVIFRVTDISYLWVWLLSGLVVSVFGTIGDLVASKFKREANSKDSSNLIPGHGGFLDRLDSLIFVSSFVYLYLQLINYVS